MIPLYIMWLVCLSLVSEALIAQEYQPNQAQESSSELPTLPGSGAFGSGASPLAPFSPSDTAQALPPEAANPSQPTDTALATGQPSPATAPTPAPALFTTPEPVPAQPTLAPTPTVAIITPLPPTPTVVATPQATPVGTPIPPSTPTPTAAPPAGTSPGQGEPVGLAITLKTSDSQPGIGQLFEVEVNVEAEAASPVDTVQVYLDFDPSILQVVEINPGATLEIALRSSFNNRAGQVDYAAGTLGESQLAQFALVRLTFQTINPTGPAGTQLRFAPLAAPRETKAIEAGDNNLGILRPLLFVIQ